jgi:hypothetical protein
MVTDIRMTSGSGLKATADVLECSCEACSMMRQDRLRQAGYALLFVLTPDFD